MVHLSCHTGSRPVWNDEVIGFVPGDSHQKQLIAGAISGEFTTPGALKQGAEAANSALASLGLSPVDSAIPHADLPDSAPSMPLFHVSHTQATSRAPKQFVDYQNDVTAAAIELGVS